MLIVKCLQNIIKVRYWFFVQILTVTNLKVAK